LAPVLTNSTINLPVSIWLEQGVAQRLKLNGAAEGGYTKLPDFLTMVGTIGNPQRSYNRAALISTVAGSVLQGLGGKNSQIGSALQGLGGVLGGNKSAPPPNQPGTQSSGSNTNKPATNQSPVGNILNQLLGPKK